MAVYLLTSHTLERQIKRNIQSEIDRLKAEYATGGLPELISEIDEIIDSKSHLAQEYGVLNQNGLLIAGNFSHFKLSDGWQTLLRTAPVDRAGEEPAGLIIRVIALPDNLWLGVGHDRKYIEEAGEAIIHAFLWGIVLVIALGAVSGYYSSHAFLKKIERITQSTQAIIEGDLKHRLSVSNNRDELDNLALLLNRMLDKLGELIENVQQVSNDIAHDLRTPVSRLKFNLEDALKTSLSEAQCKERIAFAIAEVDTILDTFSALLRICQIESRSRRSGFKLVNLSEIVASVTDALFPVAEEQGKMITTEIEPHRQMNGDRELLTQLIFNVLENAILYTPENSRITVSLRSSDNRIELIVADSGIGIAEQYRQKVFQRFYRLEQSRATAGNGLGLSIVAAIVDLHEGTIRLADNHPGLKVMVGLDNVRNNKTRDDNQPART
ncbi:MAG: sensor histidine kinase [Methylococcales bacterium]